VQTDESKFTLPIAKAEAFIQNLQQPGSLALGRTKFSAGKAREKEATQKSRFIVLRCVARSPGSR
jgi:hypothetical protein